MRVYDMVALIDKLDIFARKCYRIILGNKQSWDHVTKKSLCHFTVKAPLRETIEKKIHKVQ